ncbi:Acetylglutamate kinase [Linum grandiflorum]
MAVATKAISFNPPTKSLIPSNLHKSHFPSHCTLNPRRRSSLTIRASAKSPDQFRVEILSESLPYIQKFRGKTIVVKYGGAAMKDPTLKASVVSDLVLLSCVGLRPVLVHGGGPEINHWLKLLNIEPLFHEGLRVTDAKTMEIVSMVLVGKSYNINADTVAGELAAALGAEKLILLTDVAGILEDRDDPKSLVKETDIEGVDKLIAEKKIAGGMIPKVNCCVRSISQGVKTASIIDGRVQHSLLHELMSEEGLGTMITA